MDNGEHASLECKTLEWARKNTWCEEFAVRERKACGLFYKTELGHECKKRPRLAFNRSIGNIELRACSAGLHKPCQGKRNETIDVVMWQKDSKGKPYCFSIAYFVRDDEGYYLKFVGARPFLYVADERVPELWEALHEAQKVLDGWFYDTEAMEDD